MDRPSRRDGFQRSEGWKPSIHWRFDKRKMTTFATGFGNPTIALRFAAGGGKLDGIVQINGYWDDPMSIYGAFVQALFNDFTVVSIAA